MNHKQSSRSHSDISEEIASLKSLSVSQLKERWQTLYESRPPHRISRELLTRAVAYRIQEQAFGGLKPTTRRLLQRLANDAGGGKPLSLSPGSPTTTGTVLMRDWQGTTHEVKVVDGGVVYKRKRYRSLSEVARLITGVRWSGPLFFGLRSRARKETSHVSK